MNVWAVRWGRTQYNSSSFHCGSHSRKVWYDPCATRTISSAQCPASQRPSAQKSVSICQAASFEGGGKVSLGVRSEGSKARPRWRGQIFLRSAIVSSGSHLALNFLPNPSFAMASITLMLVGGVFGLIFGLSIPSWHRKMHCDGPIQRPPGLSASLLPIHRFSTQNKPRHESPLQGQS